MQRSPQIHLAAVEHDRAPCHVAGVVADEPSDGTTDVLFGIAEASERNAPQHLREAIRIASLKRIELRRLGGRHDQQRADAVRAPFDCRDAREGLDGILAAA